MQLVLHEEEAASINYPQLKNSFTALCVFSFASVVMSLCQIKRINTMDSILQCGQTQNYIILVEQPVSIQRTVSPGVKCDNALKLIL